MRKRVEKPAEAINATDIAGAEKALDARPVEQFSDREAEIKRQQDEALAKARARAAEGQAPAPVQNLVDSLASGPAAVGDALADLFGTPAQALAEGMEFDACWPEEMYGQRGSFSSYRVGPFRARGRVGPGETYRAAFARVQGELAEIARAERARMKQEFLAHLPGAFG